MFTNAAGGSVTNNRDAGTRYVQVSVPRQIKITDNGRTVFQGVQADGSAYVAAAGSSNQGTGALGTGTRPTGGVRRQRQPLNPVRDGHYHRRDDL
ncbi:hypothetical protein [Paraburkholderia sp. WSM4175]|uniref:hypothetical protein n=1 Tax=Paraburkholderia sp. WSM4175 TaxID=2991072 RepID=UPI003D1ACE9C